MISEAFTATFRVFFFLNSLYVVGYKLNYTKVSPGCVYFSSCITCFAGILDFGSCSASKPIESGRGADVQKPWIQMFVEVEFL